MNSFIVTSIALCFFFSGCSRTLPRGEHNTFRPYGVAHAALHFEYFGDVRGTEDIYIDSFGTHEASDTHSELITDQGFRPTMNYTVRKYGRVTIVDSVMHVELELIDHPMDSVFHLLPENVPTSKTEFQNAYEARGFVRAGDTTILGLRANIWKHSGTPNYILEWRGLILGSTNVSQGHENELRLMSFDTTQPIAPSRFIPPTGFPLQDWTHLKPGEKPPPLHP